MKQYKNFSREMSVLMTRKADVIIKLKKGIIVCSPPLLKSLFCRQLGCEVKC